MEREHERATAANELAEAKATAAKEHALVVANLTAEKDRQLAALVAEKYESSECACDLALRLLHCLLIPTLNQYIYNICALLFLSFYVDSGSV